MQIVPLTLIHVLLLLLSHFSRVRLCDPIDGSPTGSSVPGILQARTLAWVAISFSNAWKWKVKVKSLSHVRLCATPWTAAYQALPSMGFSRQEYWSGVPLVAHKVSSSASSRAHFVWMVTQNDRMCTNMSPFNAKLIAVKSKSYSCFHSYISYSRDVWLL